MRAWEGTSSGSAGLRASNGQTWLHRVLALAVWLLTAGQPTQAQAASASAIGNEAPIAIAVSPLYPRTHMVAAVTVPVGGCRSACIHLWISRDGGSSWHRGTASPPGAQMVIVQNPDGAETLVMDSNDGVVRSDDDGATWHTVGPGGTPAAAAPLGGDAVLVAGRGGADYVVSGATRREVRGSQQLGDDLVFGVAAAPTALLVSRARDSGLLTVMRCDATLACAGAAVLPGARASGGSDISLLLPGDFARSGIAFARTPTAVYRTADGGRTFLGIALPPHTGATYTTIPAAALDPLHGRRLYVAMLEITAGGASALTAGGVFASSDLGVTWSAVGSPGPLDGGATNLAVAPDGRIFAGYVNGHGDAGLVCSPDGARWQATCAAPATSPGGGAVAATVTRSHVADDHGNNTTSTHPTRAGIYGQTVAPAGGGVQPATTSRTPTAVSASAILVAIVATVAISIRRRPRR